MVKRKETAESVQGSPEVGAPNSGSPIDSSGVVQAGRTDLDLLRAGHIDLNQYVRRQAEGATAHLVGRVSDERLADLREVLMAQVLADPSLTEVVARLREVTPDRDTPA